MSTSAGERAPAGQVPATVQHHVPVHLKQVAKAPHPPSKPLLEQQVEDDAAEN